MPVGTQLKPDEMRIWLLLLLSCPPLATPARADECDQLPKPSVTIRRLEEKTTVNTQYSYRALNNLGEGLAQPGRQILGLTRGNSSVTFALQIPSYTDRSGRWECVSPQITMTYGFNPITIYVAREFPVGSCAYKEIYEHEMRHVKTYQAHLSGLEKELRETLTARFASNTPWRTPAGQASGRLQRELDERWLPFVQQLIKRVDEAQARIDTKEEYERVADACAGEIRRRIN